MGILTEATALSREVEAPPPRLMEAMEGRPEDLALVRTKFKPETLTENGVSSYIII